jgi:hypothetical protein
MVLLESIANIDTYYTNFSKYALTLNTTKCKNTEQFSYLEWNSDPTKIEKISLNVLKNTLKQYGKPVSGRKRELIRRIHSYYMQIRYATKIQSTFRGFLIRESERMRGPAAKSRDICNNETDFNTMELLTEFPRERFFSYRDANGFIYGFNVFSLMLMFDRCRKLVNPYNREEIPFEILQNVFSLYKKIKILYPSQERFC